MDNLFEKLINSNSNYRIAHTNLHEYSFGYT